MKLVSTIGIYEMKLRSVEVVRGNRLMIRGKMGIWESKIYYDYNDIIGALKLFMKPSVLLFLFLMPFRMLFGRR
ncbi:MAG: hypothetical protein AB1742_03190 [bacterium]